jgi:hypothetical protein
VRLNQKEQLNKNIIYQGGMIRHLNIGEQDQEQVNIMIKNILIATHLNKYLKLRQEEKQKRYI